MKEYIVPVRDDDIDFDAMYIYYIKEQKELIRCKDCVWYGGDDDWSTCAITPEYLVPPNGYCHRAKPKVKE